jgi:hypothetical protein
VQHQVETQAWVEQQQHGVDLIGIDMGTLYDQVYHPGGSVQPASIS